MIAGVSRSPPTTLTALISLSIILLLCTNSTAFKIPNPSSLLPIRNAVTNRKTLVSSKEFDFTPFIHASQHHRHHHHRHRHPTGGSEIDPRYGVEARLVPTGPNPLHH
ncbi:hypothetical protein SSX86_025487 [Deinandra increscens subsp. villosa]|uniref:Uncharacterized protein n=1 Tax=Deinandra increscens subsp. villosa TaxID=3103831 RepID=A0AAP0CCR5_9ASTR